MVRNVNKIGQSKERWSGWSGAAAALDDDGQGRSQPHWEKGILCQEKDKDSGPENNMGSP